jgi:hypothetical protein
MVMLMTQNTAPHKREGSQFLDGGKLAEQLAGKMTRAALAGAVGVDPSRVTRWIANGNGCELVIVARLAGVLGCGMRDLMHAEGIQALDLINEADGSARAA